MACDFNQAISVANATLLSNGLGKQTSMICVNLKTNLSFQENAGKKKSAKYGYFVQGSVR